MSDAIEDVDGLREVYRPPNAGARNKQLDRLDGHCRAFIAHSPLVMLGTADAQGRCDVSPKGGPPGFVKALADDMLAIPDLYGNNRLDSMENLLASRGIGLLFIVPGLDDTLRVNGSASITTAPDILAATAINGTEPRVALAVEVQEAFIHCAKAFRRGAVWHPEQWPDTSDMASIACMLRDHLQLAVPVEAVDEYLENGYRRTLWRAGGQPADISANTDVSQ